MKTALQELLIKFRNEIDSGNLTSDQNYTLTWAIYMAEELLNKEKELACSFAKEYINGTYDGFLSDYYDDKFNITNEPTV